MPDSSFLAATRDSYDALAPGYAELVSQRSGGRPLDRALYEAFAELVKGDGNGPVADVGCGVGWMTDFLHGLGLDAFGIDLSPGMVAVARRTYPALRFEVGSMLDLAETSLAGLLACYSIIHVPWERRPGLFAEFRRVLAPGGRLMLAFQAGDEHRHRTEVQGKPVCLDWYRQQPDEVAGLLAESGFELTATAVRQPGPGEKSARTVSSWPASPRPRRDPVPASPAMEPTLVSRETSGPTRRITPRWPGQ